MAIAPDWSAPSRTPQSALNRAVAQDTQAGRLSNHSHKHVKQDKNDNDNKNNKRDKPLASRLLPPRGPSRRSRHSAPNSTVSSCDGFPGTRPLIELNAFWSEIKTLTFNVRLPGDSFCFRIVSRCRDIVTTRTFFETDPFSTILLTDPCTDYPAIRWTEGMKRMTMKSVSGDLECHLLQTEQRRFWFDTHNSDAHKVDLNGLQASLATDLRSIGHFLPAPPALVEPMISRLWASLALLIADERMDPFVTAALAHHSFLLISPLWDNNKMVAVELAQRLLKMRNIALGFDSYAMPSFVVPMVRIATLADLFDSNVPPQLQYHGVGEINIANIPTVTMAGTLRLLASGVA